MFDTYKVPIPKASSSDRLGDWKQIIVTDLESVQPLLEMLEDAAFDDGVYSRLEPADILFSVVVIYSPIYLEREDACLPPALSFYSPKPADHIISEADDERSGSEKDVA